MCEVIEQFDFPHKYHWTNAHIEKVNAIDSTRDNAIEEAFAVALDMIKEYENMVFISGPVSSDTASGKMKNLLAFDFALLKAKKEGHNVFNFLPFENLFSQFCEIHAGDGNEYPGKVLIERFFYPLMETGKCKSLFQLPGWQDSFGAKMEHLKAVELGLEIREYNPAAIVIQESILENQ